MLPLAKATRKPQKGTKTETWDNPKAPPNKENIQKQSGKIIFTG